MEPTALLVLDIQNGVIDILGGDEKNQSYLQKLLHTITTARAASVHIIHVRTAFRKGYPEMHPRNPSARVRSSGRFQEGDANTEFHPTTAPREEEGDLVVTKHRVSAFAGTDLEQLLRGLGVQNIVIAGLVTSGAVLSTVRQAADMDYGITVLGDLCADRDEEVNGVLLGKVIARQARVLKAYDWVRELCR